MNPLLDWVHTNFVLGACLTMAMLAAQIYGDSVWRSRWFWASLALAAGPVLVGQLLWRAPSPSLAALGVALSWTVLPVSLCGASAFAVGAPIYRLLSWWSGRRTRSRRSASAGARREFLHRAVGLLPATAMAASTVALSGNDVTRVVRVPMWFPSLPRELEGLRILHLSDLHLGLGRRVADLMEVLASLRHEPPDLIVLTGDVADKVEELGPALDAVCACSPRYGVYAALGNHEYMNDIAQMQPVYERSAARLLVDETASISVNGAELFLAGVDDPIYSGDPRPFYEQRVAACARDLRPSSFGVLLCHRPEGFKAAARHGFHLTLSGHTHGGQLGLWGRSAFERLLGIPYLWGRYRRGRSQLYTTSGFGHWFPFRLGCPAEAPLIILHRGEVAPRCSSRPTSVKAGRTTTTTWRA